MSRRESALLLSLLTTINGCTQHLADQPRYHSQGQSSYFSDQRSDRPALPGTLALRKHDESIVWQQSDLLRGRERYEIYCSVCHDSEGNGNGPVVQRGFTRPAPFASQEQRALNNDLVESIISNGTAKMPGFADMISARDQKLIAGYVEVLSLRTHIPRAWLSPQDVNALGESP
jgi:mono/diheme cytochrome c family protein